MSPRSLDRVKMDRILVELEENDILPLPFINLAERFKISQEKLLTVMLRDWYWQMWALANVPCEAQWGDEETINLLIDETLCVLKAYPDEFYASIPVDLKSDRQYLGLLRQVFPEFWAKVVVDSSVPKDCLTEWANDPIQEGWSFACHNCEKKFQATSKHQAVCKWCKKDVCLECSTIKTKVFVHVIGTASVRQKECPNCSG